MFARPRIGIPVVALILAITAGQSRAAVLDQWVQFAPNDTVLLRAIESIPANGCPAASVDGDPVTLNQRGTVTQPANAPKTYYRDTVTELARVEGGFVHAMEGPGLGTRLLPGFAERPGATVRRTTRETLG